MPATGTAGSNAGANPGPTCSRRRRNRGSNSRTTHGGSKTSHLQWKSRKNGGICEYMQVIHKNKDGKSNGSGTSVLDSVTCTRRVSRHIEREYHGGIGGRGS